MTISKYIEKTHTGKKNLEDLIKDSVVSDSDFDVSYNKESIVQNRKIDQENTLVNLTVSSGFNTINADMPYRRAELNKAEPQEVIFEFLMSQVMADDFESTLPRIVSNRLSIPTTDFYIENLAIYKNAYRLSFDVVYTRNAETVVNSIKCTGFVVLPRYTINDIYNELGINTPDYFVDKFPETFFEVGRTSYEIARNFVYSKAIGRRATFEESASAKFAEQINFSENGRLNIDGLNISNSGYGVFLFENKEDWPLGGHYTYRAYRVKDAVINKGKHTKGKGYFIRNEYARRPNVWKINIGANERLHPAVFPLQLANDHVKTWSEEGDTIYDPFMGSGTTAKVCQDLNRNYIGSEISKEYCDIAEQRLAAVIGGLYAS